MLPFVNATFWNTHCIIFSKKLRNFGKLEVGNKKKVTWTEKREQFSVITFCELLFSKVLRDILPRKKAKIVKFTKVSLAKVSPIKVHLFWASHSKYLLVFIVIIIIFVIANIVIKGRPSQHIINMKLVLIWCLIRLSS